jgi:aspartyl-tRNA(Asn)/glutamyl-tRNA(Gln) amidotransferase subunit A
VTDLATLGATDLLRLYRAGAAPPVDATEAVLARIERFDPVVNAICWRDDEAALAAARASDARWHEGRPMGPLDGVPVTIKDLILTRGAPTLRGSRTIDPAGPWDGDAPASARLSEAGAVLVGKTTTPEFGWKAVTDSALTGVTRNPWDTSKTPGGSSGGAAVAAALGMGCLHVGTDGGGSIRIPAAFTGIFGLKPSFGRVPAWPLSPFGTVAHVGPMTRTVEDAALMLNVLAQPDVRDPFCLPDLGARDFRIGLDDGVRGLRVGFSPDLGYLDVDPEIASAIEAAARDFEELGAQVAPVEQPFADPWEAFTTHWYAGAGRLLAGVPAEKHDLIEPAFRQVAAEGQSIPLAAFLEAQAARAALAAAMAAFHTRHDLLLCPTLPIATFAAGQETPSRTGRWTHWAGAMYPFNLTQQPAASCPCGFTSAGLPVGLQIVGPAYRDDLVLRAARAYESAQPFVMPTAPKSES